MVGISRCLPWKGVIFLLPVALLLFSLEIIEGVEFQFPLWFLENGWQSNFTHNIMAFPESMDYAKNKVAEMKSNSKAQDKEDVYIFEHFYITGKIGMPRRGLYLEMGALDGRDISNTWAFEKVLGWRGVLLEPSPKPYQRLVKNRPDNVLANVAVCGYPRQVHFIEHEGTGGIFEFMSKSFLQFWHRNVKVEELPIIPCVPLQRILDTLHIRHIHVFSLDVEGAEYEVLSTLDFHRIKFDVILVESDWHNNKKNKNVQELLASKGYSYVGGALRSDWFIRTDTP